MHIYSAQLVAANQTLTLLLVIMRLQASNLISQGIVWHVEAWLDWDSRSQVSGERNMVTAHDSEASRWKKALFLVSCTPDE